MEKKPEKFLIDHTGEIAGRFRPRTEPEADDLPAAIESALPAA
ncbi:hypothetical protein GCM10010211_28930 [Streptomyces albospinus]|uniref:Uncharacterized protein n=1 Tax=Streptomyces albospinus TaxID=285515 RepID=A0ABQ2UZT8_9ACTN|nr:hypothetical protein GCM10010211_28930 [Streptomyces albospinus]